jgi:hypothetical protein
MFQHRDTDALAVLPASHYAALNLKTLAPLLSFSDAERCWLHAAYELGCAGSAPASDSVLLTVVECRDDALQKLATYLAVDPAELVVCTFPNRLCALQLIEPVSDSGFDAGRRRLGNWLKSTRYLHRLIERPHRSHAHFLNALLDQPWPHECDDIGVGIGTDVEISIVQSLIDTDAPSLVVDAHRNDLYRGHRLNANSLAAIITWIADWPLPVRYFELLHHRLRLTDVYRAVQRCAFHCSQRREPMTAFALCAQLYTTAAEISDSVI